MPMADRADARLARTRADRVNCRQRAVVARLDRALPRLAVVLGLGPQVVRAVLRGEVEAVLPTLPTIRVDEAHAVEVDDALRRAARAAAWPSAAHTQSRGCEGSGGVLLRVAVPTVIEGQHCRAFVVDLPAGRRC